MKKGNNKEFEGTGGKGIRRYGRDRTDLLEDHAPGTNKKKTKALLYFRQEELMLMFS